MENKEECFCMFEECQAYMELTPCCVPYGKHEAVWLEGRLIKEQRKSWI